VQAIESLLDDPARRAQLGKSARERILGEFNEERARRDCLAYYRAAGLALG
jgi:glycosyltransferase involved in cell wall biosynthesis